MSSASRPVGYAVVGLGWISQAAMLPAFANARRNSRLTALVSGDEAKRTQLAERYGLPRSAAYDYDAYDECLARDDVDAVYIAVPNHLHRQYTLRAAERGVHVLCEKPMAVTEDECRAMIDACAEHDVRLMIAYRLHFDPANLHVVKRVEAGDLGAPRIFNATFTQQVEEGDIRLMPPEKGGGPLYDIGIYCLNATRYLFRAEPESIWATRASREEARFEDAAEAISCVLRFPDERVAAFTCSFGAHPVSVFHLLGTEGGAHMENAFSFQGEHTLTLDAASNPENRTFPESDQFGPQLLYFSDCIRDGRTPEPDGEEGLIDVQIIRAAYRSLETGAAVAVDVHRARRPGPDQAMHCPAIEEPELVDAAAPEDG